MDHLKNAISTFATGDESCDAVLLLSVERNDVTVLFDAPSVIKNGFVLTGTAVIALRDRRGDFWWQRRRAWPVGR